MPKESPNKEEEPGLTQEQVTNLRIGCFVAWLAFLVPMAMLIALFVVCGPTRYTGSGSQLGIVFLGIGALLALATWAVYVPDDKDKKP